MLITQKYHCAKDIDPEFIPSLEELLQDSIPSFEWIKFQEQKTPEDVYFTYYLFFGNKHNAPVGFAQACIHNKEAHSTMLGKFLGQNKREKSLIWSMQGEHFQGLVFDPNYLKEGIQAARSLIKDYNDRDDINFHFVKINSRNGHDFADLAPIKTQSEKIIDGLLKNEDSYEDYFKSLSTPIQKHIKNLWKDLYQEPRFKLGEFDSFKDCFSYKTQGHSQYQSLKNLEKLEIYKNFAHKFFTLETHEEVLAIVFFIKGKSGHVFCDFMAIDKELDKDLLIQVCIMNFYEAPEYSHLHFLNQSREINRFKDLGVRFKEQECLTFKSHE
jgi:hypothetical protein